MSVDSEAVSRQRIAELERALAVSERCLISLTKALEKEGYRHSAPSPRELIAMTDVDAGRLSAALLRSAPIDRRAWARAK
jgi:hypothetical protein